MAASEALLDRFPDLLSRCRDCRLEVTADSGLFVLEEPRVQAIQTLLDDAIAVLTEVESLSGSGEEAAELVQRSIADLAFFGRLELESVVVSLREALAEARVWDVLRWADMGATRAEQALLAVAGEIREAAGLDSPDHGELDLGPALEVRSEYALLRYEIVVTGDPSPEDLPGAFRRILERIERLRDDPTYALVRVDDRLRIRDLQKRIAAALEEGVAAEQRERLWEDLVAASHLLLEINRREVLKRHDRRILEVLEGGHPDRRRLFALLGRDLELDRLLLEEDEPDFDELVEHLDWLRSESSPPGRLDV